MKAMPWAVCGLLLACGWAGARSEESSVRAILELAEADQKTVSAQQVIDECSRALADMEKQPGSITLKLNERRGDAYFEKKDYEASKKDYDQVLVAGQENPGVRCKRAHVNLILGSIDEAWREAMAVTRNHPQLAQGHGIAALVCLCRKDWKSGAEYATAALALKRTPFFYHMRAGAYCALGDFARCVEDINCCLILGCPVDEQADLYLLRGDVLSQLGKGEEAFSSYLMARQLKPTSFEATEMVWRSYWVRGKGSVSLLLAEKMARLEPGNYRAYLATSASLMQLERYQEALGAAEKARDLNKDDPGALCLRVLCHFCLGNSAEAVPVLDKALRMDRNDPRVLATAVTVFIFSPDPKYRDGQRAKKLAEQLVEIRGHKDGEALFLLGLAYSECGELSEAGDLLRRAGAILEAGTPLEESCRRVLQLIEAASRESAERKPGGFGDKLKIAEVVGGAVLGGRGYR